MSDFMLCPFVVALGIVGFLIATQAVSPPAVICAALLLCGGVTVQLRKKR
jgi:hypothetical protein